MIKVLKNDVPLAAISKIEFNDPLLLPCQRRALDELRARNEMKLRDFGVPINDDHARAMVRALFVGSRKPRIALSPQQMKSMREDFLKQWPEVARFFSKK